MALTSASTIDLPTSRHHGHSERALTVRRPPSASSRSSTTRRHRSHRSNRGGGHLPQNEFPNFALSGDVEIVIAADGQERRYMLHRLILAQNSGFFEASTSDEWSRAQATQALASPASAPATLGANGTGPLAVIGEERSVDVGRSSLDRFRPKTTWRYELDWDAEGRCEDIPMLIQKVSLDDEDAEAEAELTFPQPAQPTSLFGGDERPPPPPSSRSKPPASSTSFFRALAMQSAIQLPNKDPPLDTESDTIRDYDNMFRIFYNYAPKLDSVDITEAYIQCKMLLNLADMYDALEVVGPRIDHHLLQFQSRLWKQIAKYPPSYLKLGYLARSRSIFSEALVHVVGQWPLGAPQLRGIPDTVLDLIEDKAADLEELQTRIEARLLKLSLSTSRGERVNPSSHHLDWMAAAFFRGWIADNTVPTALPSKAAGPSSAPPTAPAVMQDANPPSSALQRLPLSDPAPAAPTRAPARTFRLLGQGSQAYLTHDDCKRFAKLLPESYSRDLVRRFERRIDDLKNQAREIVRPLLRQGLQLELAGGSAAAGVNYLTCCKVEEGEWPW
jgi:hypothetical protein